MTYADLLASLLETVPDEPALIDTRGVLLERPTLFGDAAGFLAVREGGRLLVASGAPDAETFERARELARPEAELVASGEAIHHVQQHLGCAGEGAHVHAAGPGGLRRDLEKPAAVLLDTAASLDALSADIAREIRDLRGRRPVAAVMEGGVPVSVCYPVMVTERYWDVSIETLPDYRRGGRAGAAFLCLERVMRGKDLEPVWGAVESNAASLALAAKLGFERVGEIRLFSDLRAS